MITLTSREAATVRAALALWLRTSVQSPALLHTASENGLYTPLDPEELEELIGSLKRTRVCVTDTHNDVQKLVRQLAAIDTDAPLQAIDWRSFVDDALALVERLDS